MMTRRLLLLLLLSLAFHTQAADPSPRVLIKTNQGEIEIELNAAAAPVTVENFLRYVDEGFYNGTIFHRVINGFMIQGGGFTEELDRKRGHEPITNEAKNGLSNRRGTIAMARTNAPHSATSQFFINHKDNKNLDHPSFDGWGYAVFGQVTKGLDTVDRIANTSTRTAYGMKNVPVEPVVIESVTQIKTQP